MEILIFVLIGLVIFAVFFKEFKYGKLILKVIAGLAVTLVIVYLITEIYSLISFWFL